MEEQVSDGFGQKEEIGHKAKNFRNHEETIKEFKIQYLEICNSLRIRVVTRYLKCLSQSKLTLRNQGVGSKTIQGVSRSLHNNIWITDINFSDNNIDETAAQSIGKMLQFNHFIECIDLSCNQIGVLGFESLANILMNSKSVRVLSLSSNDLPDKIAHSLQHLICINKSLQKFDLSRNDLSGESAKALRMALELNTTMKSLNLSWNKFRREATVDLAKGIAKNNSLDCINLSWNGFSTEGIEAIGKTLAINNKLTELDLSYNRILNVQPLCSAMKVNKALKTLKLGGNPLLTDSVDEILTGCDENVTKCVRSLHVENVYVNAETVLKIEKIAAKIPGFEVLVAGHTKGKARRNYEEQLRRELLGILKSYLVNHRLRMVDLFNQWDKDKSYSITREEFRKGVQTCGIPFSEGQLNILIQWLDNDGSDSIEYSEFVGITNIE